MNFIYFSLVQFRKHYGRQIYIITILLLTHLANTYLIFIKWQVNHIYTNLGASNWRSTNRLGWGVRKISDKYDYEVKENSDLAHSCCGHIQEWGREKSLSKGFRLREGLVLVSSLAEQVKESKSPSSLTPLVNDSETLKQKMQM